MDFFDSRLGGDGFGRARVVPGQDDGVLYAARPQFADEGRRFRTQGIGDGEKPGRFHEAKGGK